MIEALLLKVAPWLAGLLVVVVGFFYGRRSGKDSARKELAEKIRKDSDAIHKADQEVAKMADDDVRVELRRWVRDDD